MDGGAARAALTLMGSQNQGPVRWRVALGDRSVEVIAEPEAPKLGFARAAAVQDGDFARLGAADPSVVRARLAGLAVSTAQTADDITDADPAQLWRLCARSLVSPYGAAQSLPTAPWTSLQPNVIGSRTGQLWRIRLASADGWTEDRIVRFTGSMDHPTDLVADRFGRGTQMGEACDHIFAVQSPR